MTANFEVGPSITRRQSEGLEGDSGQSFCSTVVKSGSVARFWRYLLPAIFVTLTIQQVVVLLWGGLGSDAEIYYRAGAAWLAGENPWDAYATYAGNSFHFYAAPTAAIVMAPFSVLPEEIFVPFWIAVQAAAAVFVVRRLNLPLWWLLFPPVVAGVLSGNPSLSVLALLLIPHPVAGALASMLKVYAGLPLLGERRWAAIAVSATMVVASVVVAPMLWSIFIGDAGTQTDRLMKEANGGFSGFQDPPLFALGLVAIIVIARLDLRQAGWLAPIALWPASQFHWSTLALPVMNPLLALGLAFPVQKLPVVVIAFHAWLLLWRRLHQSQQQEVGLTPPAVEGAEIGRLREPD